MKYFAGIEAGGTKFVCSIGDDNGTIIKRHSILTNSPSETIPAIIEFFKPYHDQLLSLGIGAFGPVDLNKTSPTYGHITHTPKTQWKNFNFLGAMKAEFDVPMEFDTDVNVAALGEHTWGEAQNLENFLYITVGTGVGVGGMINGKLMHGLTHPEMGHIPLRKSPSERPDFEGICPYHKDCLEGLAAGPAINTRWNVDHSSLLKPEHIAWDIESDYLAHAVVSYILICSPQKIIMGGGVMNQSQLFPMIHDKVKKLLNGYIKHPSIIDHINQYIVPPGLGDNAGCLGAIALAQLAYQKR